MNSVPILMQMCTEDVYRKNVFHILGLPADATPRQVRRRREDLDSARSLGNESRQAEFKHWLGGELPSKSNVDESFKLLEDPESRIISELFWFWPIAENDPALADIFRGQTSEAISKWLSAALDFGKKRTVALHNLAVIYHVLAIEGEFSVISGKGCVKTEMENNWQKSFSYWEKLADEDDFWDLYEQRMREFDDPRLTGGFVRRVRQEFPIAFDNINARIALMYARRGNWVDAQRHVQYMKKTMSGIDDIEQSFEVLFEPMEARIGCVIKSCGQLLKKDGANGSHCAEQLLEASEEVVKAANCLLGPNNQLRCRIFKDIFQACNGYLVAFGNQTKQWDECLSLYSRLKPLACTEELRKKINENESILKENAKRAIFENTCFSCGKRGGTKRALGDVVTIVKVKVFLIGDVQRNYEAFGSVKYVKKEVEVPCCEKCKISDNKLRKYGPVAKALQSGYVIGPEPTETQMRGAWGLPSCKGPLRPRSVWGLQKP